MTGSSPQGHDAPDVSGVTASARDGDTAAPDAAPSVRTHVVQTGDSLSTIAEQVYGQAGRWTDIYAANRHVLDDPDCIHAGQVLQLPAV
ncbi:LysM peptidoglycan-binding domain-containing protein [Luteimonas sp. WGS1318]|uniref:LysM peptidoglycan-binding domain-containing protein n=1 Tax=Luteimonas sp. WGS1318 TaxID=3366815 RepID=UPI00372D2099